jgi:hypothetical protein
MGLLTNSHLIQPKLLIMKRKIPIKERCYANMNYDNINRCFGKDVLLQLQDGSKKCANGISIGDKLLGIDNRVLTVIDVVSGNEISLYRIITKNGSEIKVTGQHVMKSENHSAITSQLKVGDPLSLADGSSSTVISIDIIYYNDTVYNYIFDGLEEGAYIIANGFYAGDFRMQNQRYWRPDLVFTTAEQSQEP